MSPVPLLTAQALAETISGSGPALLDVRWELASGALRSDYERGHIPGAAFVDLHRHLASPPGPRTGRHPLPEAQAFTEAMRAAGVWNERPVIVYDAATSTAAARAWWLLRYFGHSDVRVLDGGLAAWTRAGGPLQTGTAEIAPGDFSARPGAMPLLGARGAAELASGGGILIDARAPERFRGEAEPIDPVAGHIPGAVNRPTTENLGADGRFCDPRELRRAFERLGVSDGTVVGSYCGSGVTAAHEVLALEVAGFSAALYGDSWSGWITDPRRPIARSDD